MAPVSSTARLLNPLATPAQLETSSSQLDGVSQHLEDSIRFETARLIQAAGILLRLPQELIAQAVVILQRYCSGPEGGSFLEFDSIDIAAASLYLTAKPSGKPVTPRQLLTSFEYLSSLEPGQRASLEIEGKLVTSWHLSEIVYETRRASLYEIEARILRALGFQTHVALPYALCISYLQTLDVFQSGDGSRVARRAFAHLNTALLSPQLLYLTHQPSALATAAIYLAAREVGVKLPEVEWWEVFDLEREELGFLVVAMLSTEGFALEEDRKWHRRKLPLTVESLQNEIADVSRSDPQAKT